MTDSAMGYGKQGQGQPVAWSVNPVTYDALHQSLFPPIPTPLEVRNRLNLH